MFLKDNTSGAKIFKLEMKTMYVPPYYSVERALLVV
jgi:hypothetical protein